VVSLFLPPAAAAPAGWPASRSPRRGPSAPRRRPWDGAGGGGRGARSADRIAGRKPGGELPVVRCNAAGGSL